MDACSPLGNITRIQHNVQTNGILINSQFCDVFRTRNVRVGISIDGPKDIHNRYRVTRSRAGTFDAVMRGLDSLREAGLAFNVICVLTSHSLDHAEELYDFFERIGAASVGFNVDELEGANSSTSMNSEGFFERLASFWRTLFRVHFQRKSFILREADMLVNSLRYGEASRVLNQQSTPFSILTISVDGAAGTFSPELLGQSHTRFGNFAIGDILTDDLVDLLENPMFSKMASEISLGVKRCAEECSYFEVCGGGAPSNKLFERGSFAATRTRYCEATKIFVVDAILDLVEDQQKSTALGTAKTEAVQSELIIIPAALDEEDCRACRHIAESQTWIPSSIEGTGSPTRFFSKAQLKDGTLFAKISSYLPKFVDGRPLKGLAGTRAIYIRYATGDFFPLHVDSPYIDATGAESAFTLMIYLNDDFEGSETYFPDIDRLTQPRMGTAVLFPHHLRHEGKPLKSGIKLVLHTFVLYGTIGSENLSPAVRQRRLK
jgi:uncharacterized protein